MAFEWDLNPAVSIYPGI